MKTLFRVLIIGAFFAIIFYYTNTNSSDDVLQGPDPIIKPIEKPNLADLNHSLYERPKEGISLLIGESTTALEKQFGQPTTILETVFTYDIWIYNNADGYIAVGVKDGRITQIYTNNINVNTTPYLMDTLADDIYASTIIDPEITVEIGENLYILSMNEKDALQRILVKLDSIYAQLYIDEQIGQLVGVRFLEGETLVENKTYEMQFLGELMEVPPVSSEILIQSQTENANQLYVLVNSFRQKYGLSTLTNDAILNDLALVLSEKRYNNELESLEISNRELNKLLDEQQYVYKKANEIVALSYKDPIEVMHGLLNSEKHRAILFDENSTKIGIGHYGEYYSQIIIEDE